LEIGSGNYGKDLANLTSWMQSLRAKYPNIPKLPGKTFFKLKANDDIKKRREELHDYLQV